MNLAKLFNPTSLAVIGASDTKGKLGYNVLRNLLDHGYAGEIYPVNRRSDSVQGLRAYRTVSEIGKRVDAAVVIVPAANTPEVVEECFRNGIEFVTVESAGFGELGGDGRKIENRLRALVAKYGCHILGPNCSGIINVNNGLCQSIGLVGELRPGNVGLIAQAGVYAAGILWGLRKVMDFGLIATIGNKVDIDETDILEHMGQDPSIKVIAMYLEDIRRGERFLEVAREIVPRKPVIVLKGGRTEEGKAKAVTHTAAIGGSNQAYEAVFNDAGIIQARDNDHLFDLVRGFSKQPLPTSGRMMVITYSGSQGITATDRLSENGKGLARLSEATMHELRNHLPEVVGAINPADLTFDQSPQQVKRIIEVTTMDGEVGGVIANLQPEILAEYGEVFSTMDSHGKPVLISVTGREFAMDGAIRLEEMGYPVYSTPERTSEVISAMHTYSQNATLNPRVDEVQADTDKVRRVLDLAKGMGLTSLGGVGAFEILRAYGIPVVESRIARSPAEAEEIGSLMEGPLVYKIESSKVLHKSDLGGVRLGVTDEFGSAFSEMVDDVLARSPGLDRGDIKGVSIQPMLDGGKEILIGSSYERTLGCHVIKFGLGGKYTEVFRDVSNAVVPIDRTKALNMIGSTRFASRLLEGQRGERPYDVGALVDALLRFSQLVRDFPEISEIEANPLMVWESGAVVVDARMAISAGEGSAQLCCEDGEILKGET